MSTPVRASDRDLRALAAIVSQDRPDLPDGDGLPPSLLGDLMGQIRCDALGLDGWDAGRQTCWFSQEIPSGDAAIDFESTDQVFWDNYWDCQPCSYAARTGDQRSVITCSDFYSARQWHSTGMYSDYLRPFEHNLLVCLPAGPGPAVVPSRSVRLCFWRGHGRDFSDRDLLALLRPHLHQAYLDAVRRRHGVPRLTRRHWELLRLVAAGHTNSQIARRLGVSEGTVRIHLQNIYARLQVSSRTAAVTRAFSDLTAT